MLGVIVFLIALFLILPVFIIVPLSFNSSSYISFPPEGFSLQWYQEFFNNTRWVSSLRTSAIVGVIVTILALIFGIMISMGLSKSKFKGKSVLEQIFMLPMMIPAIVYAVGIYRLETALNLSGTMLGIIIAHTILAIPYVVSTVYASLQHLNPNYAYAAANLGANKLQTLWKVIIPIIKPAIFSASLFAFSISFDEIIVTQFLAGIQTLTLPMKIWEGVKNTLDPTITALASMLVIFISILLLVVNYRNLFPKKIVIREDVIDD